MSSDFPPITVAIATYNGARYLEEQLDSILHQTYPHVRIVVSDDGSTDGTLGILEKYRSRGQLSFGHNGSRSGYITNFKNAVSLASAGQYVALSDQDDIWLPRKLEEAMRKMQQIEVEGKPAMVYSDLVLVDQDKNLINPSFSNELNQDTYRHCLETLLFGGFVNGCTMLMNPEMVKYFHTISENGTAEHDSWITLSAYTFGTAGRTPDAQIWYRRHVDNATGLINHSRKSRFQRLFGELSSLFKGNDLFERELITATQFYEVFHDKLTPEQKALFTRFLALRNKSYLEKKIALRSFFRGKWIRKTP